MHKIAALIALAAAGCVRVFPEADVPVHGDGAGRICNDAGLAAFQGRPATSEVGAEILTASGAGQLRWVAQGSVITMEFSASRVTVRLDAQGRVASATCG